MRVWLLFLASLTITLAPQLPAQADPAYLFSVGCRNGAIVPWIAGRAETARVCALELIGEWTEDGLRELSCTPKLQATLSRKFFHKGAHFDLLSSEAEVNGPVGSFEVLAVEEGVRNPSCGLVGWGKDDLNSGERPVSRYTATPRSREPRALVNVVSRKPLGTKLATEIAHRWLFGRPDAQRTPLQISEAHEVTSGEKVLHVIEVQGGEPDASGRFPLEGILIANADNEHIVDVVVEPKTDVKTTRMHFLDVFDAGADGKLDILLFERYRDGTGDFVLVTESDSGWRVALRTGELDRRRYRRPPRGSAFQ